ncbi:hypothetical protein GCM10010299_44830 [Streptomyces tanashiensis]|nr:hypothetical protein GCM10010299_44830 [Streptomyces tanashiensis]
MVTDIRSPAANPSSPVDHSTKSPSALSNRHLEQASGQVPPVLANNDPTPIQPPPEAGNNRRPKLVLWLRFCAGATVSDS